MKKTTNINDYSLGEVATGFGTVGLNALLTVAGTTVGFSKTVLSAIDRAEAGTVVHKLRNESFGDTYANSQELGAEWGDATLDTFSATKKVKKAKPTQEEK